jgi:6-phosphogluconate dehydrogenase
MSAERGSLDIGVVGLGVMGGNLARNLADKGFRVGGQNLDHAVAERLAAEHPEAGLTIVKDLVELLPLLKRPRRLLLLVPSGGPVDAVIEALDPHLEDGDTVVDGGNSHYAATDARLKRAEGRPWEFVGMGVSGGAEGALKGPSLMPGGAERAYDNLAPLLTKIAAQGPYGPCVAHCGEGSAGHFVKMVHNGIEYGDMQLIAEVATLLREGLGQPASAVADTFASWNEGELESFLVEITGHIFRTPDPEGPEGAVLVDAILDRAGQKGTGRWTVVAALELGVAIPTIAAAVDARVLSAGKATRVEAERVLGLPRTKALEGVTVQDLGDALYAAKVASYTQGLELLRVASEERGYGIDRAEIARIWTAGCIIRARLLGAIREAMSQDDAPLLALDAGFAADLRGRVEAFRRVVAAATLGGHAIPGLSASLHWLETLSQGRGSASVIQAQRDYFGSHTYRRLDAPDAPVHTDWPRG